MTPTAAQPVEEFRAGVPGIHEGIPAAEYHGIKAVSSSSLKRLYTHSPLHCRDLMSNGMEASDEMNIGSAAHCLLFTPSEFDGHFACAGQCEANTAKGDRCRYGGSERHAGHWLCGTHAKGIGIPDAGFTVLSPDDMERTRGIVRAVRDNPVASDLLDLATDFELSILVKDEATGLLLKARLDIFCRDGEILPDLKTCRSSDPRRFMYQARDLAYHIQIAFYRHVARLAGLSIDVTSIIAVENTRPYAVTVFETSERFMAQGESDMHKALATFAECSATGHWPGYATGAQLLDYPA